MGHTREKKPSAYTDDAKLRANYIVEDFSEFVDGVRVLLLIHRSKDGATHSTRSLRMIFTNGKSEFEAALGMLIEEKEKSSIQGLRIYSTVNHRNIKKAALQFKHSMVDTDYSDKDTFENFYLNIKSGFASALMKPSCRDDSYFVFDIDDPMTLDHALSVLDKCDECDIVKQYKTKNGWHIITRPFNYTKLSEDIPLNKDGLILLAY